MRNMPVIQDRTAPFAPGRAIGSSLGQSLGHSTGGWLFGLFFVAVLVALAVGAVAWTNDLASNLGGLVVQTPGRRRMRRRH